MMILEVSDASRISAMGLLNGSEKHGGGKGVGGGVKSSQKEEEEF